jgi:hypothetical protein
VSGTSDDDQSLPEEIVRAYASGEMSWREIRERTGKEDFSILLEGLSKAGLRLPRAARDRPSQAKAWLAEALVATGAAR